MYDYFMLQTYIYLFAGILIEGTSLLFNNK